MEPITLLVPVLILVGIMLLAATEIAILYRPDLQATGSIFGIFFTIVGIRLQFTDAMFSALPTGLDLIVAILLQVALGLALFITVHHAMQRINPYLIDSLDPPHPN